MFVAVLHRGARLVDFHSHSVRMFNSRPRLLCAPAIIKKSEYDNPSNGESSSLVNRMPCLLYALHKSEITIVPGRMQTLQLGSSKISGVLFKIL